MITINQISDEVLLGLIHTNNVFLHVAKNKKIGLNAEEIQQDQDRLMREVNNRLPISFKWDFEQIQRSLSPRSGVHPGNYYRHKIIPLLKLQIVEEHDYNGPLWSCRCFAGKLYACRMIIRNSTLLEHFRKI